MENMETVIGYGEDTTSSEEDKRRFQEIADRNQQSLDELTARLAAGQRLVNCSYETIPSKTADV